MNIYCPIRRYSMSHATDELGMHISWDCFNFKKLKEKMGILIDSKILSRAMIGMKNMIKQQKNKIKEHNKNVEGKRNGLI